MSETEKMVNLVCKLLIIGNKYEEAVYDMSPLRV
jgi:hypothetical protein